MKLKRKNKPGAGRSKAIRTSVMALMALCLLKVHIGEGKRRRAHRKAARAGILAYFAMEETEPANRVDAFLRIDAHLPAVLKELQRLETGKAKLHPAIAFGIGAVDRLTGLPALGSASEIAQGLADEAAQFLGNNSVHRVEKKKP